MVMIDGETQKNYNLKRFGITFILPKKLFASDLKGSQNSNIYHLMESDRYRLSILQFIFP